MEAAIRIEGLVKNYEKFSLDHINLEIPKGSIVGLVGANGAGKTTLIKCILGIIKRDAGEIYVDGEKLEEKNDNWKNQVGMVLAEANFHETMNAVQIGRIMENIFSQWDAGLYETYLNDFKLEHKKLIKDYSRGMKMKLQIAVALSHRAKILIFDEATSGLDPLVRDDLLDILLEYIQDEAHTVLLSSHIISDLEKVSDYIAFIQNGISFYDIKRDAGEIYVDGEKLEEKNDNWKNQVGMVLAEANFHETMNAVQIGRIMENIFSQWDAGLYETYLNDFKLEHKKLIKDYSRGMKMKLQIAVALSHRAKILIFDEATSGLDPLVRDDLLDILLEYIQDEAHTVLLSSHIISDLEKVSDYIAFIQNGRLLFVENKDEILYRYGVGKCSKEDYSTLDKEGILRLKRGVLGYEFLVQDRQAFMRRYPDMVVDAPDIEDVLLLLEKGEVVS